MRVTTPTLAGLQHIFCNLRARDRVEMDALMFEAGDLERANRWLLMWLHGAFIGELVLADDGEPVAIYILTWISPGTLVAGLVATDRWPEVVKPFNRYTRETILTQAKKAGVRRIEARVWEGHADAVRMLEFIGARAEGRLQGLGRNGESFIQYAWLNPELELQHVRGIQTQGLERSASRH